MRKLAASLLLLSLLAGCGASAHAATTYKPTVYTSGNSSELVTYLPVTNGNPQVHVVVFCIDLGAPPVGGEVLAVTGDMEVTDDLGYEVSINTHLLLTDSCTTVDGTEISEANGSNITPSIHHLAPSRAGVLVVENGNSRHAVIMAAWAASTGARPGDQIKVEGDYGRLTILRWTS